MDGIGIDDIGIAGEKFLAYGDDFSTHTAS
jgi:hypothetical protein